jgi:hypothetical protein
MSSRNRSGSFFCTLLGYLLLAAIIIVVFAIVAASVYWSAFHVSDESAVKWGKWLGLGGRTVLMFGWVIKQYRRLWRNKVFCALQQACY